MAGHPLDKKLSVGQTMTDTSLQKLTQDFGQVFLAEDVLLSAVVLLFRTD